MEQIILYRIAENLAGIKFGGLAVRFQTAKLKFCKKTLSKVMSSITCRSAIYHRLYIR